MRPQKSRINWRKIWQLRYRAYAILVIVIIAPILFADNSDLNPSIDFASDRFQVVQTGLLASRLRRIFPQPGTNDPEKKESYVLEETKVEEDKKEEKPATKIVTLDKTGIAITDLLKLSGYNSGYISNLPFADLGIPLPIPQVTEQVEVSTDTPAESIKLPIPQPLDDLVPKPAAPQYKSFLRYPKYNINTPIIYTNFDDLYLKNPDGTFNFSTARDNGPVDSPVQRKLQDGIVHLVHTPMPGEMGNSYIVGHSSNFSFVKSNYNTVFKPIESKSRPGEEFFIYDRFGRELKFRVFEAIRIEAGQSALAYQDYPDKRVVTLQTSILTLTPRGWEATHRWLTRGELVL